jgi:2-dehydropantoate 2-reductase
MRVDIAPDVNALVWGKLVVNAAINPLTALLRLPNGALLERPAARLVMAALARETAAIALAQGVNLPFTDPVAQVEDVARRTAANRSSMFQDVARGARTEIDAICGAVVRAGEECALPAPVNRLMWQMVSALQAG